MSCLSPFTSFLQSTEKIQSTIRSKFQWRRYASFSCCANRLMSKHGPQTTVHILRRSTSSMMILFSMYSISIGHFFWAKTRMMAPVSSEGSGNGPTNDGGTTSHKFAKDGEPLYLDRHPTCVFASSVHMARQLQTCWHIHLPFLLSSTTLMEIAISVGKMKRE